MNEIMCRSYEKCAVRDKCTSFRETDGSRCEAFVEIPNTLRDLKRRLDKANSNFHFDNLDWNVRVAFAELCKIVDERLENIVRHQAR